MTVREVPARMHRAKCLACGAGLEYADDEPFQSDFEHSLGLMFRYWAIMCVRCRELEMLDAVAETIA